MGWFLRVGDVPAAVRHGSKGRGSRWFGGTTVVAVVSALAATLVLVASPPAGSQEPSTCFGREITHRVVPGQVLRGTSGPDVILGTDGDDIIKARGGNDRICSGAGNDQVWGQRGRDRINLGPGNDVGKGGPGNDKILGKDGRDVLNGGSGNDTMSGGADGDELNGQRGDDTLRGKRADDVLRGHDGDDRLYGGTGADGCDGGPGRDRRRSCANNVRKTASGKFKTLRPGATLPSEAECAAAVDAAPEVRGPNKVPNRTRGTDPADDYPRVSGFFTGTTDEILQWAACKWGIHEDLVRAQAVVESWWRQSTRWDFTSNQSHCHPVLRTNGGQCPQTVGILQIMYRFHRPAFEDLNAITSTAYNADYAYAYWRDCYEGGFGWLNDGPRGREYAAGDAVGCMGVWFSGEWYTDDATPYMDKVKRRRRQRFWETDDFTSADEDPRAASLRTGRD